MKENEENIGIQIVQGRQLVGAGQRGSEIDEWGSRMRAVGRNSNPLEYLLNQILDAPVVIRYASQAAQEIVKADLKSRGKTIDEAMLVKITTETQSQIETAQLDKALLIGDYITINKILGR